MIAMNMEYLITAPKTGTVTKVPHKVGDFITKGTALVEFADEEWCDRKKLLTDGFRYLLKWILQTIEKIWKSTNLYNSS